MSLHPTTAEDFLPRGAPRLGFGCGDLYGGAQAQASAELVAAALDAGVRWFDTARLYGDGGAEGVLGRALAGRRDQVVLVSKAGILPWSMQWGARLRGKAARLARRVAPWVAEPPPARELYGAFSPRQLIQSLETSLRALRTDYLDLLLLHECRLPHATSGETLSLLEKLRRDGKIRGFGIATQPQTTLEILTAAPRLFDAAQFASDALDRTAERLPGDWRGLTVTHSAIKDALGPLRARVTADRRLAAAWAEVFGAAAEEPATYVRLLLQDALAAHGGVVLFSTSRPGRIVEAVEAAAAPDPERLAAFRRFVATSGCESADAIGGPGLDAEADRRYGSNTCSNSVA